MPIKGSRKKDPLIYTVTAYLSKDEFDLLCELKERTGKSYSEIIRMGIKELDRSSENVRWGNHVRHMNQIIGI